jgi:hypothetical protein
VNTPKPCGTLAAYHRHLRHRELPCDDCTRANREAKRTRGTPTPERRKPIAHGTRAGYRQHRYRGEAACPKCLAAENAGSRADKALARRMKGATS